MNQSLNHLFFDCVVAKRLWIVIDELLDLRSDWNFEFYQLLLENDGYNAEQDLGTMVDSAIQMLENKASQHPRICWNGGRSQLETSAFSLWIRAPPLRFRNPRN